MISMKDDFQKDVNDALDLFENLVNLFFNLFLY